MIISKLVLSAALTCPPTKMNIISPLDKKDKDALLEHKARCLAAKAWPCLYTFEKKGEDWYVSTCGPMVNASAEDK